MAWLPNVNMPSGESIVQALLTVVCIFLIYKFLRYLIAGTTKQPLYSGFLGRRLGHGEEILDIFSVEKNSMYNLCLTISLTSKQTLAHQHIRDALVLLAKRQPMLRAVIRPAENEDKYFEIKEIKEVISMIDITHSDVKASHWQDVWLEYTAKQRGHGLLWGLVILQEEFIPDTQDYANTLMFTFNHSCTDGVSCVKFCKQFLNHLNELSNGTSSVDQEISSLNLLPFSHDIVTRTRTWHSLFNFTLAYCGLRPILNLCMRRMVPLLVRKKQPNPYYAQYPPNSEVLNHGVTGRLNIKVFNEDETKNIIKACKANNCTATGAITTAAHLAFCQLIEDSKAKNMELECGFVINGQRFCDPKPHEDYLGLFLYMCHDFRMKYMAGDDVDFWKVAQETTRRITDVVSKEAFIAEETVLNGTLEPGELLDVIDLETFFRKSSCNIISSFGSFNFRDKKQEPETYKLHECFINNLVHDMSCNFFHFNHTINGKMTWQIASDVTVDTKHAEKFAGLCFDRFIEISRGGV